MKAISISLPIDFLVPIFQHIVQSRIPVVTIDVHCLNVLLDYIHISEVGTASFSSAHRELFIKINLYVHPSSDGYLIFLVTDVTSRNKINYVLLVTMY